MNQTQIESLKFLLLVIIVTIIILIGESPFGFQYDF
jgi:hypothetical protein